MSAFGEFDADKFNDTRVSWMRRNGVRKAEFTGNGEVVKLELFGIAPTMPAALAFEPDEPAPEEKPPGICVHPGCGEKSGWQFAREFCRDHGLAAAGVTRAR